MGVTSVHGGVAGQRHAAAFRSYDATQGWELALPGTLGGRAAAESRRVAALDWALRENLPLWLRSAQSDAADVIAALPPVRSTADATAALRAVAAIPDARPGGTSRSSRPQWVVCATGSPLIAAIVPRAGLLGELAVAVRRAICTAIATTGGARVLPRAAGAWHDIVEDSTCTRRGAALWVRLVAAGPHDPARLALTVIARGA